MEDGIGKGRQGRPTALESRAVAAADDEQLAGFRRRLAAAERDIQGDQPALAQSLAETAHATRRNRCRDADDGAGLGAGGDAVRREQHVFDLGLEGGHHDDEIAHRRERGRRRRRRYAVLRQALGGGRIDIVAEHGKTVAGEVTRDRMAHLAEPDHADGLDVLRHRMPLPSW